MTAIRTNSRVTVQKINCYSYRSSILYNFPSIAMFSVGQIIKF